MRAFLAILLLLTTGCATISSNDFKQAVLVTSEPPGAVIYEKGQRLGVTPAFVPVQRHKTPHLELQLGDQPPQKVPLNTQYRWWESFAGNLLFLAFAPVGWVIDWTSGNAWDIQNPPPVVLLAKNKMKAKKQPQDQLTLAIAPPANEATYVVEELGEVAQKKFEAEGKYKVKPYLDTQPTFAKHGSASGLSDEEDERNQIFSALQVDRVFVSEVKNEKDKSKLSGYLLDPLTKQKSPPIEWNLDGRYSDQKKTFFNRFKWLPNTIFVNFASSSARFNVADREYAAEYAKDDSSAEKFLRYINTIGLSYQERPRENVKGHWKWSFVPTVNISQKTIELTNIIGSTDLTFKRNFINAGYGGEFAYISRFGTTYIDLIPAATWTRIHYDGNGFSGATDRYSLGYVIELGHTYFFSEHFVGKFFSRSISEDSTLWKKAFKGAGVSLPSDTSVSSITVGFAIGYYFPQGAIRH